MSRARLDRTRWVPSRTVGTRVTTVRPLSTTTALESATSTIRTPASLRSPSTTSRETAALLKVWQEVNYRYLPWGNAKHFKACWINKFNILNVLSFCVYKLELYLLYISILQKFCYFRSWLNCKKQMTACFNFIN